ncbi:carboxylesterase/lipase family protein [Paenibacillus methanolicus]|uniref:Para-nitrobenzyl esterase n=1 Tax=Paenibacillus methanolicus TaxID=582686 RepID=A0A5S5CH52_9BACL|nr:carboxylesterase family protein [Paenibacillus methanolicus]TYP79119.1 para-nitrobenzyl esterase [Paenibacillus methanolicus]
MLVQTCSGLVRGAQLDGAFVFRGIPYAAPPTGELRFKAPAPARPWQGIRHCDHFGPIAPQKGDPNGFLPELPQSEDCLTLNVWTTGPAEVLKPVLFYIHGGGFVSGKGADCDGRRYAAEDGLVYVSINYRLGALGFLYLGELLGEAFATSGNTGMLDIVAALQWVRRNIAAFGGDPSRVTAIGNSAGAKCAATLYTMEAARGLFAGVIAQSGATQSIRDRSTANVTAQRLLDELGLARAEAHQLLELPAERLIEAQSAIGFDTSRSLHMFGPVADGRVIPDDPLGSMNSVSGGSMPPLLIGSNEDEAAIFIQGDPLLAPPSPDVADRLFGANAPIVWVSYRRYSESMPSAEAWRRTLSEHLYTIGAMQFAAAVSDAGAKAWVYRLRCGGSLGAIHGYESSLINGLHDAGMTANPEDPFAVAPEYYPLARSMRAAWVAFAKTGNPNVAQLPEWPTYGANRSTMVLDRQCRVGEDLPEPAGAAVTHQVWRISACS